MERTLPTSLADPFPDSSPLLREGGGPLGARNSAQRNSLSGAARFLRRASSRRMMREPSMRVRETAAEQLEERQSDWAYSKPVVVLDLIWNLAFVIVALVVLGLSRQERPSTHLRLWTAGYSLQCLLHMVCVCFEYRRRHHHHHHHHHQQQSFAKRLESANTMFSFVWWIVGFYWITAGGQALIQEAPQLYWLCVVFLAFDVLFVVFCVALACVIGIAVCCCLPCIIAILYAVADQEGASEEDISAVPKFVFHRTGSFDKAAGEKLSSSRGLMSLVGTLDGPRERLLSAENAECCICLSAYQDGVELRELPCSHHFHCTCIDKWLHINATCPLCKFNIIKSNSTAREDA